MVCVGRAGAREVAVSQRSEMRAILYRGDDFVLVLFAALERSLVMASERNSCQGTLETNGILHVVGSPSRVEGKGDEYSG